jgi:ATP/maltotriose-dependent transcriptional regulator MalT
MAAELVGRAAELRGVRQHLRAAHQRFRWIQVLGEPGIGKTQFLATIGAIAEESGFLVLAGRGSEQEGELPFGLVVDAVDDYLGGLAQERRRTLAGGFCGELAAVFPSFTSLCDPSPPGLSDERYRTFRAVRGLLDDLARTQPLVLLLDDVHWADEASRQLISFLLRRPSSAGLLLVLAWRPGSAPDLAPDFAAAARDTPGMRVELGPLDEAEATSLLGRPVSKEELGVCGGNPFYLLQLARHPQPPNGTGGADPDALLQLTGLPVPVALAVADEIGALPPRARQLAQAAAVVGEPFETRHAAAAADMTEAHAFMALDELVAAGIVRQTDQPTRFRFRQPIVRAAVYATAAPGWRLATHRRLANALATEGVPASVRARHVALTAAPDDTAAIEVLSAAAAEVQPRAPATAADWWRTALTLLPRPEERPDRPGLAERRLGLLIPYAAASGSRGDLLAALGALEEAAGLMPSGQGQVALQASCATIEHGLGRFEAARERLHAALSGVADDNDAEASRAALLLELAVAQLFLRDFAGARQWAIQAAEVARGPQRQTVHALMLFIDCSAERYRVADGRVADVAAAFDASVEQKVRSQHRVAAYYLGSSENLLGRYSDAARHLRIATAQSGAGQSRTLIPSLKDLAKSIAAGGDLDEAVDTADMAVDLARIGENDWMTAFSLAAFAEVTTAKGELPRALDATEEALHRTPAAAHHFQDGLRRQVALIQLESGQPQACLETLEATGGPDAEVVEPGTRWLIHELVARAYSRLGDIDAATAAAERASAAADDSGLAVASMSALRAQAEPELARGRPDAAARLLQDAVAVGEACGAVLDTARTRLLAGRALLEADRGSDARQMLTVAEAALRDAGAGLGRDEAARLLRRLGVARPGRTGGAAMSSGSSGSPSPVGGSGGAQLTAREREIAERVLAGASNREIAAALFLSEKTVEGHLRRLYTKLGIRRRGALAAALTRNDQEAGQSAETVASGVQ